MPSISLAETKQEVRRCFPVMAELRTHLAETEFIERVLRQQREHGYRLVFLEEGGAVQAVAGFRIAEYLAWGKILYVDDLVTTATARSTGLGQQLFDWLLARARAEGCDQLHLDSGVEKFAAHRFYLRNRLSITSHHFSLNLR
jgi:GNAT superfamily N-acetyltransferase